MDNYIMYQERFITTDNIGEIWLRLKPSFPTIFKIAQMFLSAQCSSSEVERVFSNAGFLSSIHRSSITPKHLEMKLIISMNKE